MHEVSLGYVCDHIEGEYKEKGPGHIVRSGRGTHTSATGTVYSGEWQADTLNGKGGYCTERERGSRDTFSLNFCFKFVFRGGPASFRSNL